MAVIYIENLSDRANQAQMQALFEAFGTVVSMRLTPSRAGHRGDGFGLVEMEDTAAHRAIAGIHGTVFQGAVLSVREAVAAEVSKTGVDAPPPVQLGESPLALMRRRYELAEVEKVSGPRGAAGDDWYRYVLVSRASRIDGFRRGSLADVTEYAKQWADVINDRTLHCRSGYHMMASRGRKPTTSK
jgi:hypothetical protein